MMIIVGQPWWGGEEYKGSEKGRREGRRGRREAKGETMEGNRRIKE